jgi:hypothetical protein
VDQGTPVWIVAAHRLLLFAWFMLILIGALVLRFVLAGRGAWPWA